MQYYQGTPDNKKGDVFICSLIDEPGEKNVFAYHGLVVPSQDFFSPEIDYEYESGTVDFVDRYMLWSYKSLKFDSVDQIRNNESDVILTGYFSDLNRAEASAMTCLAKYMVKYAHKKGIRKKKLTDGSLWFGDQGVVEPSGKEELSVLLLPSDSP